MSLLQIAFENMCRSGSQYLVNRNNGMILKCSKPGRFETKIEDKYQLVFICRKNSVFYFYEGDEISINSGNINQTMIAQRDVTYWGIAKL